MKILLIIFTLTFFPFYVWAQQDIKAPKEPKEPTRIEVDHENSMFRFIIDDEEVARLGKNGLVVRDEIAFGGTMRDHNGKAFADDENQTTKEELK